MASDKVQNFTDSGFDAAIKGAAVPVLVDFWAEWCQPCLRLGPVVEALAAEYDGKLVVAKMNVDENPVTPGRFGVRSIPMLILFKGGKAVEESIGVVPKERLKQMIDAHVAG